uniref:Light-independent protochlorophyllide reductase subunit B n=1 Tax=Hildenbrandia rivularis TaxID=135206 RepID=A0A1C9CFE1_9FLOR|nr:photochlorophyllide reductase [Hildenbrandia rivularis]AOM67072.1 photochlorophyllide reductase [Hildenbrandia rivularis]
MKLAYWMYAGPAHIGTLRIASSFNNVHAIMHAPLGDDYFNVMRSMLERERDFTPVTASIVDRHVLARGSREKVVNNILRKDKEERPDLIVLTPTCTSSILQEDLHNFAYRASLESSADVLLADVNHYRVNELQASDRTLEQIVRFYLEKACKKKTVHFKKTLKPSVNIIGVVGLGFHNQHDLSELRRLFGDLNISINLVIPEGSSVHDLCDLPCAWFNCVPYREVGMLTAQYLQKEFNMPFVDVTPMGLMKITNFIRQVENVLGTLEYSVNYDMYIDTQTRFISQSAWFSRSIDCQNLTGKTAVVFGDLTHASSMARILHSEMGVNVKWVGTYCKYDAEWFRNEVSDISKKIVFSEDHAVIAKLIKETDPAVIFGTQMERHIGKKLGIPCGVISSPVHIQNFPLSYRPFLGYEGTNQIADLIYNSFTLGMEDHLLDLFGGHDVLSSPQADNISSIKWSQEAILELNKIPGFVRKTVKKNTEFFASQQLIDVITVETMYLAKEKL